MPLKTMNNKWADLEFEDWFVDIHHWSAIKTANNLSKLNDFVNYCEGKHIVGEGAQPVKRALIVTSYVSNRVYYCYESSMEKISFTYQKRGDKAVSLFLLNNHL